MTRLMDWTDRGTCVLFGDGAGAVVVEPGEGEGTTDDRGLLGFALCADGNKQDLLYVDGGVSTDGRVGKLRMQGNQVFRHAVVNISEAVRAAAADAGVEISQVDWFIPHQANQRILEGVARRLGIDESKVISTVAEHANTSAASIPLALDHLATVLARQPDFLVNRLAKVGSRQRCALHSRPCPDPAAHIS